jgi:preprotein translocase subunit SecA
MDYLREGIGLRAYSQRDPLVEYQREGFELFAAMMDSIKEESVGYLFNVEVQVTTEVDDDEGLLDGADTSPAPAGPSAGRLDDGVDGTPAQGLAAPSALEPAGVDPEDTEPADAAEERPHIVAKGLGAPSVPKNLAYSAPTVDGDGGTEVHTEAAVDTAVDEFVGVSRNEACPCGSGRKFKRCHGDPARRRA